jgi:ornithine carbamoyltransferase
MPKTAFTGRDFIDIADFSEEELGALLDLAAEAKARHLAGEDWMPLLLRTLGMLFMKKSTRTRVSFEVGMYELGGSALFLSAADLQLGHGETIRDTANTLSRYLSAVMIRAIEHADVVEFALHATIPVINGMTNTAHPCQALADLLTIREHFGRLEGTRVAYFGAGLNVAASLMVGCAKVGAEFSLCCPEGYEPPADRLAIAHDCARRSGGNVSISRDPLAAVARADVVYTDGWTPPELAAHEGKRADDLAGYQVNAALLARGGENVRVMHCLPAHYGEEITEEVVHSPQSIVFDQAENRLHAQKAIMAAIIP